MQIYELTVEVRDPDLERVGQLTPEDLVGAVFVLRFNNTGSWQVRLPFGSEMGDLLRTPGYGLLVTGPNDEVIISGPTMSASLEQTADNIQGDWVIMGADDSIILNERLAYPTPTTDDLSLQTAAEDIRSGFAETVIKEYLDANLGASAPVNRQVNGLVIETDEGRGQTVNGFGRWQKLQELFYDLAQVGQVGYQLIQKDNTIEFSVYEPQDRSQFIRLDLQNEQLESANYSYQNARITRAIVGGPGEAEEREYREVTNADSLEAETVWGRRIEVFTDSRGTEEDNDLEQSGLAALVDEGKTIVEMSVVPSDNAGTQFGVDWFLGDTITVVANEIESVAVVTEVGISIQDDGIRVAATVGTPVALEFEARLLAKTQNHEKRLSNLERSNTGFGINVAYEPEGGTDGTQPTFSGPAIFGSFNRFGNMSHFAIQVDFDNITSFGTGQYYVTLPYPAKHRYTFANGHLLDVSSSKTYNLVGETAKDSDVIKIYYIGSNGQMDPFTFNSPVTLTTADYFDISGTYEIGE